MRIQAHRKITALTGLLTSVAVGGLMATAAPTAGAAPQEAAPVAATDTATAPVKAAELPAGITKADIGRLLALVKQLPIPHELRLQLIHQLVALLNDGHFDSDDDWDDSDDWDDRDDNDDRDDDHDDDWDDNDGDDDWDDDDWDD